MALTVSGLVGCVDLEARVGGLAWPSTAWCDVPRDEAVACVLDGDTVDVGACGENDGERIRLLGVAAPEIAHEDREAGCYGDEAHALLDDLLTGERVRLEFDQQCADIYGRTLAWIYLEGDDRDVLRLLEDLDDLGIREDGTYRVLVNELLIRAGAATVFRADFADDVRFIDELDDAEDQAESEGLGLWTACDD